jgi:probable HAF family extracellular repeat protein
MNPIRRLATRRVLLLFSCAVFTAGAGRAEVTYSVRDLGSLGGASARAYAINDAGWVVGEAETREGHVRAFLWTPEAGMQDLGSLGGASSRAFAINERGEAAGEAQDESGRFRPFRWSADYGMEALPTPPGIRDGFVYAMNNFGVLVGGSDGPAGPRALVWSVDGVATPAPLDRFFGGVAHAVNDLGVIAGRAELPGSAEQVGRAFLIGADGEWRTPAGGAYDGADSAALALNARGEAVGYRANGRSLQAVWFSPDPSEAPRGIDTLDNVYSVAYDINDRGEVVGLFSSSPEDDDRAFVWRDGAMLDLNEWIESAEPWHLVEARGINNRGEIVGYGLLHERERAVLLTPRPKTGAARPAIRIVAPPSGLVLEEGDDLTLEAAIIPADARVRRVVYYANGVVIGSSATTPHRLVWSRPPAGVHHLVAVLIGADGRMRRSERIAVTVALKYNPAGAADP